MTGRYSVARIWRWPSLFAIASVFGLFSALLGQTGVWLPLSWIALSAPILTALICIARGRG